MEILKEIKKIIIHHSHQNIGSVEIIREKHIYENRWEDIGYHWIIGNSNPHTEDGKLYFARSEKFTGAHVKGENHDSIGICLIGNLDQTSPTTKQTETLLQFLKHKLKKHKLKIKDVFGHNEFPNVSKSCPGKFLDMKWLRRKLKKKN